MGLDFKLIYGQTPLDDEEKEGLKLDFISTKSELDEFEQKNIEEAVLWLYGRKFKIEQIFSEKFILDLHKRMYGEVWTWAGKIRTTEKNIGVKHHLISIELKQLLDDTIFWIENETFLPDEIAIRFKHRLVSIHCFANGNGRHSRLMADIIIEKIFKQPTFSWGANDLYSDGETRSIYIKSVKEGDKNNIEPLVKFARS